MVRQPNPIEQGLDSSIKQFYVVLHGHLSVSPENWPRQMPVRAVDAARLSGMALRTLRSAKLMGLLRFAEYAAMRVALILTTLLPFSLRYRSGTSPGARSDRGFSFAADC
jgi:hypothetical protein